MTRFLEQRGGWVRTGAGRHEAGSGWGLEVWSSLSYARGMSKKTKGLV